MELSDKKSVSRILESGGFTFKKSLGQNFLIDPSVCPAMADAACGEDTGVIEIGPGAGVLTAELAKRAKRVVSIELDERLRQVLAKTLADFDNVKLIFADVMKTDLSAVIKENFSDCGRVTVCANLPYYITSPVIMSLLESRLPVESITVMVQKEAAQRLCAEVGSRDAGAVTAAVKYYAESEILFEVPKTSFMPPPKVDSAVIQLKILEKPPVETKDEEFFFKFVKACFAQRRKTLVNTVSSTLGTDKEALRGALADIGLEPTVRGEALTLPQLAELADCLAGR
mgnify:FL=1